MMQFVRLIAKENWSHWVYPECPVEDVWVCDGYPVPAELPSI